MTVNPKLTYAENLERWNRHQVKLHNAAVKRYREAPIEEIYQREFLLRGKKDSDKTRKESAEWPVLIARIALDK